MRRGRRINSATRAYAPLGRGALVPPRGDTAAQERVEEARRGSGAVGKVDSKTATAGYPDKGAVIRRKRDAENTGPETPKAPVRGGGHSFEAVFRFRSLKYAAGRERNAE
eukprot:gene2957-3622_t